MNRVYPVIILGAMIVLGMIGCSSVASRLETPTLLAAPSRVQAQLTETLPSGQKTEYTLVGGQCSRENCLFFRQAEPDWLLGVATISGYYAQTERSAFEQTKRCDSFVLIDGPTALTHSLLLLIDQGNTLYTKNELGQPMISLDLSTLQQSEKQRLISSSDANPVSLLVLGTSPTYQGVPVCFSHLVILRVK